MEIMHKIKMDLAKPGITPRIPVVQGDTYTRRLSIALYSDRRPWSIPSEASVVIRYRKPDRTSGTYDTLSDGTSAVDIYGNTLNLSVAPEAVSLAGTATLMVTFFLGQQRLSTFSIDLVVAPDCVSGWSDEEGAAWIAAFLPSPEDAEPGQHLVVDQVDDAGHVLSVKTLDLTQWLENYLAQNGIEESVSISHAWDGTILTVTSASGTSSADLKGAPGKSAYEIAVENGFKGTEGEWLASLRATAEDGSEILLGQTPITLSAGASVKLVGAGEHTYTVKGKTVADISTMAQAATNAALTQYDNYIELVSTGGSNWYNSYITLSVSGLTVGESYILAVSGMGVSLANLVSNGHFIVRNASGTTLATLTHESAAVLSVEFTPDTTNITIVWYPAGYYYWNNNCRTARIADIYINEASAGTMRTDVRNESGTFTDTLVLGQVSAGVTITTEPTCEVYQIIGSSGADLPLASKTVVCFGDSLFGMYTGDTSAPAYVAERTGATVYNVGFGGCRMSVHPYTGYNEFSMYALAAAIVSGDWSAQDAAAASGSSNFPDQLAILKEIDFANVDYIVIHYGTNDFTASVALDNAEDSKDYNTLCGALRYSIEALLGAYPELRIFVSVPAFRYWTADDGTITYPEDYTNVNGNTLPAFVEAIAQTAKEYNLPVIDSYYGLGINKINAATFLADGVHHNVTGRKRFGDFIGSCLIAPSARLGDAGTDDASLLVVTFTTDDSGTLTPSHTYAQIKAWVNNGGSAVLTNGNTWYNLAFMNSGTVWFERTIATASGSQYTRYVISRTGNMTEITSEYKNIDVTSEVGQTIIVKEVDENGKPTAWETVDHQPRTHYETFTEVVPETAVEFDADGFGNFYPAFALVEGKRYRVTVNGETQVLTAVLNEGAPMLIGMNWAYLILDGVLFGFDGGMAFAYLDETSPTTTIAIEECDVSPIPEHYLTNAFPYSIEVTGEGTSDNPYACSEIVETVESIYYTGRSIVVKHRSPIDLSDGETGYLDYVYSLNAAISNSEISPYGRVFAFTVVIYMSGSSSSPSGNTLWFIPQEDGTYSISNSLPE